MIANEYGISLSEIKELNDLKDDVIYPGQNSELQKAKLQEKLLPKKLLLKNF